MSMKKFFLVLVCAIGVNSLAFSQDFSDPRYARFGEEVADRSANVLLLNYFRDAYGTKSYDDALVLMHQIIERCPKASLNVYLQGNDIYRIKMARAQTKVDRFLYLDSMLYLFDVRAEHFGTHSKYGKHYSISQKALIFHENNKEDIDRAYSLFRTAIDLSKDKVAPDMCIVFFNSLTDGFKIGDITPEEYITDYELVMDMLSEVSTTDADKDAMRVIENLFAGSGAASCDIIEQIFRPKYEANPNDMEMVRKLLGMLSRSKCSSDFQLALTEKYYKAEPTPELAAMLGGIYEEKKDYDKALLYFGTAIEGETDQDTKINLLIRAANASVASNNNSTAAGYARQIISIDPENGYGHLYLAAAYAGGARGCSGFDQQAAYWLVVDAYARARSKFVDDETQVSNINKMIGAYTAMFPKTEDTFMRGLSPGQGYSVSCGWLSGRTTVRER